jgi:hypothetical protein
MLLLLLLLLISYLSLILLPTFLVRVCNFFHYKNVKCAWKKYLQIFLECFLFCKRSFVLKSFDHGLKWEIIKVRLDHMGELKEQFLSILLVFGWTSISFFNYFAILKLNKFLFISFAKKKQHIIIRLENI